MPTPKKPATCEVCGKFIPKARLKQADILGFIPRYCAKRCRTTAARRRERAKAKAQRPSKA